jgi:hypothetical protein
MTLPGRSPGRTSLLEDFVDLASELRDEDESFPLRRALYGGVLSSLGATLGWFLWIAADLFRRRPREILASALIGFCLGLLVEGFNAYRKADDRTVKGQSATFTRHPPGRWLRTALISTGVVVFSFLTIVGEDIFVEVIGDVVKPFTASLLTLFPIGAFFSLIFQARVFMVLRIVFPLAVLIGAMIGGIAALIAGSIYLLMGQSYSSALVGWWVLLALGCAMTAGMSTSHPLAPFSGCVVALVAMVYAATLPLEKSADYATGSSKGFMIVATAATNSALTAPDLPSAFWTDAEARMRVRQTGPVQTRTSRSTWGSRLARWADCETLPTQPSEDAPQPYLDRKKRLCEELLTGVRSGLARSWLVIAFFSLGLGLTHLVDERLRPVHYENSRTRALDRILLPGILSLIVVGAIALRFVS